MVRFMQMNEFMHEDVLNDGWGKQNRRPMKIQGAIHGAGSRPVTYFLYYHVPGGDTDAVFPRFQLPAQPMTGPGTVPSYEVLPAPVGFPPQQSKSAFDELKGIFGMDPALLVPDQL